MAPQSWEPTEATVPPAEALSGYAAHFAEKNRKPIASAPAPNHVAAPVAAAPSPAPLAPEKTNGPSTKSLPQVEETPSETDSTAEGSS
jgi:hypothetical protein